MSKPVRGIIRSWDEFEQNVNIELGGGAVLQVGKSDISPQGADYRLDTDKPKFLHVFTKRRYVPPADMVEPGLAPGEHWVEVPAILADKVQAGATEYAFAA